MVGVFNLFAIKRVLSFHTCRMWPLLCLFASFAVPWNRCRPLWVHNVLCGQLAPSSPSQWSRAWHSCQDDVASPGLCREVGSPPSAAADTLPRAAQESLLPLPRAQVGGPCSAWSRSQTPRSFSAKVLYICPSLCWCLGFFSPGSGLCASLSEFLIDENH